MVAISKLLLGFLLLIPSLVLLGVGLLEGMPVSTLTLVLAVLGAACGLALLFFGSVDARRSARHVFTTAGLILYGSMAPVLMAGIAYGKLTLSLDDQRWFFQGFFASVIVVFACAGAALKYLGIQVQRTLSPQDGA